MRLPDEPGSDWPQRTSHRTPRRHRLRLSRPNASIDLTERELLTHRRPDPEVGREDNFALRTLRSRQLVFLLVGVGIFLRVAQYLANRSLWIDEAWLALNLLSRSFEHLTKPLDL